MWRGVMKSEAGRLRHRLPKIDPPADSRGARVDICGRAYRGGAKQADGIDLGAKQSCWPSFVKHQPHKYLFYRHRTRMRCPRPRSNLSAIGEEPAAVIYRIAALRPSIRALRRRRKAAVIAALIERLCPGLAPGGACPGRRGDK